MEADSAESPQDNNVNGRVKQDRPVPRPAPRAAFSFLSPCLFFFTDFEMSFFLCGVLFFPCATQILLLVSFARGRNRLGPTELPHQIFHERVVSKGLAG